MAKPDVCANVHRVTNLKLSAWVVGITSLILFQSELITRADTEDQSIKPKYELRISTAEARLTFTRMLELKAAGVPLDDEKMRWLFNSYRFADAGWWKKGNASLRSAPYFKMMLAQNLPELYGAAYDFYWNQKWNELQKEVPLELLFDGFLQAIVDNKLPPEIVEAGKKIGSCLAKRSLSGKSDHCELDPSEAINSPSIVDLALVKSDCQLHTRFVTACHTRRVIYNAAKEELVKYRKDPHVRKAVEEGFKAAFPQQFRDTFLEKLDSIDLTFLETIAQKMGAKFNNFWSTEFPWIEVDDPNAPRVQLRSFSLGLNNDLQIASMLADSSDIGFKSTAGALFYASANRLLVLTGGQMAMRDRKKGLLLADNSPVDPAQPKKAPQYQTQSFGGWSAFAREDGQLKFGPWDWANYNPETKLALFPNEFLVDERGRARSTEPDHTVQDLFDLSLLMDALTQFLDLTRSQGVFGKYFAEGADLAGLVDPKNPVIFPKEGRMLAMGALGAILKNLAAPNVGHLEQKAQGDPNYGLGVEFHQIVHLTGRDQGVSLESLSRFIISAIRLNEKLASHPEFAPELASVVPALNTVIELGGLYLGAKGQRDNGSFKTDLGIEAQEASPLANWILGCRALTGVYNTSQRIVQRVRIEQAWKYLDSVWSPEWLTQGKTGLAPSDAWEMLVLWSETQTKVRPALPEFNWAAWDQRMEQLKGQLLAQLDSKYGPSYIH